MTEEVHIYYIAKSCGIESLHLVINYDSKHQRRIDERLSTISSKTQRSARSCA